MIRDLSPLFNRIDNNPIDDTQQIQRFISNYYFACDVFKAAPSRYATEYLRIRVDKLDPDTQELQDVTTNVEAYPADMQLIKSNKVLKTTLDDMRKYLATLQGDNEMLESMAVEVSGMISDITGILG